MPPKPFLFAAALLAAFAALGAEAPAKKSALDKATLEAYVRHLFVFDSSIEIKVSDPTPAPIPGFVQEMVHAARGGQSQDFTFYISKDGAKIVQGVVYDVANNPFKSDLDKLQTTGAAGWGTAGAPVVLVEFSDFQCPHCKDESKLLRDNLLKAYPTQVKMYFKEFPLDTIHPWAKPAAMAGRCIFRQSNDAFWDFHDWIFSHQDQVTADNLKSQVLAWAGDRKDLDSLKLGQCMDSNATQLEVESTQAQGKSLEVNSTPTLFVNGRRIPGAIDWPSLKGIIDYEIEYQKTAKDAGDDCGCSLDLKVPGGTAEKSSALPALGH